MEKILKSKLNCLLLFVVNDLSLFTSCSDFNLPKGFYDSDYALVIKLYMTWIENLLIAIPIQNWPKVMIDENRVNCNIFRFLEKWFTKNIYFNQIVIEINWKGKYQSQVLQKTVGVSVKWPLRKLDFPLVLYVEVMNSNITVFGNCWT